MCRYACAAFTRDGVRGYLKAWVTRANPKRSTAELRTALKQSLKVRAAGSRAARGRALARELIILPRFKRDYRQARKHPEFESETLEYVLDLMISGGELPEAFANIFWTSGEAKSGKRMPLRFARVTLAESP